MQLCQPKKQKEQRQSEAPPSVGAIHMPPQGKAHEAHKRWQAQSTRPHTNAHNNTYSHMCIHTQCTRTGVRKCSHLTHRGFRQQHSIAVARGQRPYKHAPVISWHIAEHRHTHSQHEQTMLMPSSCAHAFMCNTAVHVVHNATQRKPHDKHTHTHSEPYPRPLHTFHSG